MDSNDNYPVHIGTWTNWSRGAVMGSTLTIRRDVGNLLIAFVAFFVAWGKQTSRPRSIVPSLRPPAAMRC